MTKLTTLSQLGARTSLARLHVKLLLKSAAKYDINHAFYLVDPENKMLRDFVFNELTEFGQVRSRKDNFFTPFGGKKYPKFGGDFNYDFLLRGCVIGENFLTLHDDTLIYKSDIFESVFDSLEQYKYGGFLDQRAKGAYSKILLDGIPMGELRIGTWFLFGNTNHYRSNEYRLAVYKNYYKWLINLQYRSTRISTKRLKVWLNGGFDLNLRARLDGNDFAVLDELAPNKLGTSIEHFEKVTGFFYHRGMMSYVDQDNEADAWKDWLKKNSKRDESGKIFEIEFMKAMVKLLEQHDVDDKLLNAKTINKLEKNLHV